MLHYPVIKYTYRLKQSVVSMIHVTDELINIESFTHTEYAHY